MGNTKPIGVAYSDQDLEGSTLTDVNLAGANLKVAPGETNVILAVESVHSDDTAPALVIYGANNSGSGRAGAIDLEGGRGDGDGDGGSISIEGGVSDIGDGGNITIRAGFSESGTGGNLSLGAGSSNSGVDGRIDFVTNNTRQMTLTNTEFEVGLSMFVNGLTTGDVPLVRIRQLGDGPALFIEDITDPTTAPTVFHSSGGVSIGNEIDVGSGNLYATGNLAGDIVTSVTKLQGPVVEAASSAGGILRSNNGTQCAQWGAGGGANVTLTATTITGTTNINPVGLDVSISPTSGGKVSIRPNGVGNMDNVDIGLTTRAVGSFTNVGVKGTFTQVNAGASGDPQLQISLNDVADAVVVVPSVIGSSTAGTLIIDVGDASVASWTFSGGDLFPSQGTAAMTNGFAFIPGAAAAPTGTPTTTNAGVFPMYVDSTSGSEKLYIRVNGTWKFTALT